MPRVTRTDTVNSGPGGSSDDDWFARSSSSTGQVSTTLHMAASRTCLKPDFWPNSVATDSGVDVRMTARWRPFFRVTQTAPLPSEQRCAITLYNAQSGEDQVEVWQWPKAPVHHVPLIQIVSGAGPHPCLLRLIQCLPGLLSHWTRFAICVPLYSSVLFCCPSRWRRSSPGRGYSPGSKSACTSTGSGLAIRIILDSLH